MSHERGLGQPRPAFCSSGCLCSSSRRAAMKPVTSSRAACTARSDAWASTSTAGGSGHPAVMPMRQWSWSASQLRWTKRLARAALSSHTPAVVSVGFAAAMIRTPSGSIRSPTARSSTTRSSAACTAGGAVEISSRNRMPRLSEASRTAQAGGARSVARTTWSPTFSVPSGTGRPAKSDGSRIAAITVSHRSPMRRASASMVRLLPTPGAPHSSTGTPHSTATASASACTEYPFVVFVVMCPPSSCAPWPAATRPILRIRSPRTPRGRVSSSARRLPLPPPPPPSAPPRR